MQPDYLYKAIIVNAVDGDTLDVDVDLGFRITMRQRVRLYGINTPERGDAGHLDAKEAVSRHVGKEVTIRSHKPEDKYGRWLATVYISDRSLADMMIADGLGVAYFGGKR